MVKRLFVTLICLSLGVSFAAPTATCFGQENEKETQPAVAVESPAGALQEEVLSTQTEAKSAEPKPEISSKETLKSMEALNQETAEDSKPQDSKTPDPKTPDPKTPDPKTPDPKTPDPKPQDPKPQDSKQDPAKKPGSDVTESKNTETPAKPKVDEKPAKADPKIEAKPVARSEEFLPASTKFWISVPDPVKLEEQFKSTQFGTLAKDPAIQPFIDSLADQIKDLMNKQNVSLGLKIDDMDAVQSGEICIAGVVPDVTGKQITKGTHGLVVLVDVSKTEDKAKALQKKINAMLKEKGAEVTEKEINGVMTTKAVLKHQKPVRFSTTNHQAVVNGWMLVSDNETIFRDVLARLNAPQQIQKAETLASLDSFKRIMEETNLDEFNSHFRWYVDPFGYIQLAQALEDERRGDLQPRNDFSKVLKDQGFGAFKAMGGNLSIATGEHEILHRSFTYAPRGQKMDNSDQIFKMFNFAGNSKPLEPANWVPKEASALVIGNWDFSDALGSVGGLYDGFLDEKGAFERTLNDFKVEPDMQLDIVKLVGLLDNRMTIASAVERPIAETSERVVIGIPVKDEPEFVFESLRRATNGQVINLGGIKVIEVDSAAMEEEVTDPDWILPGDFEIEEEEEEEPAFQLFAKKYFVVHGGNLLIANNKGYLRKLLSQKKSKLSSAPDYIEVKTAIDKLTDDSTVCWRQFGRMDLALEANYEMVRRGEMASSQTVLARVVNQVFKKQAEAKAAAEGKELDDATVRMQKLDGSKLPENYEVSIAPYFGPMGWVMETHEDGWRITGCIIKKKPLTEVVQKTSDKKGESQQR
ncbi:MAG: hypothetical protein ACKVHR_18905 [Pirellulales bacterium]